MLKKLNIIEAPLNSDLTAAVLKDLTSTLDSLTFQSHKEDKQLDFISMTETLLKTPARDLFIWEAEDIASDLPEGLDYFLIPELDAGVIFKSDDELIRQFRTFYCPPVAFIGGGPGNHEWLTIEAKIILDRCDIVFYDALVNPLIVAALPEDVDRFFVGKRGDSKSFNQDELNRLIVDHAKRGFKVGRLKGGDPCILGRITEEVDALMAAGLSFHIIPGISAMQAISSSAGIHLTQRGVCDRVTLTTARSAGGDVNNLLPFKESSLIVYMGVLSAEKIAAQLLEAGYREDLPTAILVNLTRSAQKIFHTTLKELAKTVKDNNIRPPGLLLFGETARKDLQRLPTPAPLIGRKVLLTSTCKDAIKASSRLRRWGATPIFLYQSLMSIDGETIMPKYDDIIFFSPKEVSDFYEHLGGPKIVGEANIVSMGKETDATCSCLFRRPTTIAGNYKEAVTALKKKIIKQLIE